MKSKVIFERLWDQYSSENPSVGRIHLALAASYADVGATADAARLLAKARELKPALAGRTWVALAVQRNARSCGRRR